VEEVRQEQTGAGGDAQLELGAESCDLGLVDLGDDRAGGKRAENAGRNGAVRGGLDDGARGGNVDKCH
jgi:hypothetical protein